MAIPQIRSQSLPTSTLLNNVSSRRQSAFQSFGLRRKADVEIVIDGGDDFIHSYSTFDEIKGHVCVRFEKDTLIDDFHIWLQGETNTWVARMAGPSPRSGRATARHVFLKIQQPIGAVPFSENNIAKAGVRYQIPFKFVVPDRLLPFVCSHKVDNDDVKDQHLLLPPSIGDEMIAGEGQVLMDDLAPSMSKIVYTVRTRLAKASSTGRQSDVITESTGIRIIPSRNELPPASVADGPAPCLKFQLRAEKNVRKGLFRMGKKQGRLTAETAQPRSIILPHPSKSSAIPATTMTTVHLRYDPATIDEQPPQLSSFSTKLKVFTFFGAGPFKGLPAPNNYDVWSVMHGLYPETVSLSSMNLTSVSWKRHEMDGSVVSQTNLRRSSVATTVSSSRKGTTLSEVTSNPSTGPGSLARRPSTFSNNSDISSATSSSETSTTASSPSSSSAQPSFPSSTISPSTSYNSSLPYYTTSVLIPITLPSSHSSDQPIVPTPIILSTPTGGTTTLPIKQRSRITFLPTFHSCLISRTYALEICLSTQGTNAPSLNLRSPIQLTIDQNSIPTSPSAPIAAITNPFSIRNDLQSSLPAPIEFYDPFSLPQANQSNLPDYSTGEYNDIDSDSKQMMANDEAIARALDAENYTSSSSSSSLFNNPNNATNNNGNIMEQIPEYSELQIQCFNSTSIPTSNATPYQNPYAASSRRMSTPAVLSSSSSPSSANQTGITSITSAGVAAEDAPPEYYSSFRRASTLMNVGLNRSSRSSVSAASTVPVPTLVSAPSTNTYTDTNPNLNTNPISSATNTSERRSSLGTSTSVPASTQTSNHTRIATSSAPTSNETQIPRERQREREKERRKSTLMRKWSLGLRSSD